METVVPSWISRSAALAVAVCSMSIPLPAQGNPPGPYGFVPDRLPATITQGLLEQLAADTVNRIWGFIGRDYSGKILTSVPLSFLSLQSFDQQTRWPPADGLPDGFDPEAWLETGKDPGLEVRRLNRQGVDGQGVSIAVIDKPIRSTHSELEGRITYIEVFGGRSTRLPYHFHGIACASILAGRSCGVAPGTHLYYFAVPDNGRNFLNYSQAVDRLLEVNQELPADRKIRLVSISDGMVAPYDGQWSAARGKLRAAGIEVLYSSSEFLSGFVRGGCPPYLDRQGPDCYELSPEFRRSGSRRDAIIIPGDYRTTASNAGDSVYVYWGQGGWSWAIPYVAGLSALALQIRPSMTYPQIETLLRQTARTTPNGTRVLMPVAFIEAARRQ